jgi:threonine/homoserine/homoserine lactone efflux protein
MVFSGLLTLLFKGILVGFMIAAPVGPIGILCIRRTLSGCYALGFVTGLGAAVADTFYGAVVGFSLATVQDFIQAHSYYLHLTGGFLLGWIGLAILRSSPRPKISESSQEENLLHGFVSAFLLTISNPLPLLVFGASFAAVGVATANDSLLQAFILVFGVFIGASAWWLTLSTGVKLFHKRISDTHLLWINRFSGLMLLGFSLYMLASLL